jgi:hypothetical protein
VDVFIVHDDAVGGEGGDVEDAEGVQVRHRRPAVGLQGIIDLLLGLGQVDVDADAEILGGLYYLAEEVGRAHIG